MSPHPVFAIRRADYAAAIAAIVILSVANAHAQPTPSASSQPLGRIDFDDAGLPPATVEVDLTHEMFSDMFGLGDAAVAGVAETFLKAAGTDNGSEGTRLAAEQLTAAREIIELARDVVHEVRVRVYEGLAEQPVGLIANFDGQLHAAKWDTVVRVRNGNDNVRVSLLRNDGKILGAFVVAASGHELVLVNVVGDISPENVKKLTSSAAQIGLENGLGQVIEAKMREFHRPMPPAPPQPPAK